MADHAKFRAQKSQFFPSAVAKLSGWNKNQGSQKYFHSKILTEIATIFKFFKTLAMLLHFRKEKNFLTDSPVLQQGISVLPNQMKSNFAVLTNRKRI